MDLQPNPLAEATVVSTGGRRPAQATGDRNTANLIAQRILQSRKEAVETLIPDSRAELSPAQSVERKLTSMLRGAAIPVSHIRLAPLCGKR